jgi:hypothetical protein
VVFVHRADGVVSETTGCLSAVQNVVIGSSNDFTFDRDRNVYVCPTNKLLKTTGNVDSEYKVRYLASRRDCGRCPLKPQCSPKTPSRKITRDVHEDARDHARSFVGTPEFDQSRATSARRSRCDLRT